MSDESEDAQVHVLPPLRRPDKPVPVVVLEGGEWPGFVTACRGSRVLAVFSTAPGLQQVRWLSADRVRGGEAALQDLAQRVHLADHVAPQPRAESTPID